MKECKKAVNNGQTRLALEYAILLLDQLMTAEKPTAVAEEVVSPPPVVNNVVQKDEALEAQVKSLEAEVETLKGSVNYLKGQVTTLKKKGSEG